MTARKPAILASTLSVRRAFETLFFSIVDESPAEKKRGCFGLNSVVELTAHDAHVASYLVRRTRSSERIFYEALERARASGELAETKDTQALSRFLLSALQGLRISAKADPSSSNLGDIARIALHSLDRARRPSRLSRAFSCLFATYRIASYRTNWSRIGLHRHRRYRPGLSPGICFSIAPDKVRRGWCVPTAMAHSPRSIPPIGDAERAPPTWPR